FCSLKPAEDRLVKAVRLELDARGRLVAASFGDAVIRSAARLTYTQVRQALVDGDPSVRAALGGLLEPLERAEALARLLIARRRAQGSIDFDLPEAEVVLDLRGRPADNVRAERSNAHQMLEEFMQAANEVVGLDVALRGAGRVPPDLVAIAEESSRRERVAMEAEREIVQLKKIQFMQDKVGGVYEGFVSGVAPFGFFVELCDVFVEGLVHVTALGGDYYEHVEAQHL